jgi:outer membrane receptor protein involved in Fe transport
VLHVRGGDEPFTQMLFDGVPINISGGYNDIGGMLLTNVERVELARGALSPVWGSSAMAGAVQFITREGQAGPPRAELSAEGGNTGARGGEARSEATVSGGDEHLRYSAGLGFAYNRGVYGLPNNLRTGDGSLRLDWRPAGPWNVTAIARYMAIETHLPVRDPGATRVPLDPYQRDRHYRWIGSLSSGWAASPTWHHRLTAGLLWDDFLYHDAQDSSLDVSAYPFFIFNANFWSRGTLLRPSFAYVGSNDLAGPQSETGLSIAYGATWQREMETYAQTGDYGPANTFFGRNDAAVFSEVSGHLGARLAVLAGARVERIQGLPAELLPRASVVVAVVPGVLSLRAAAGRSFKSPNVDQQYPQNGYTIPNPGLQPETSVSWETGATLTASGGALTLGAGWFHHLYAGLIETVNADTGTAQTNKNLGRTQASGLELDVERRWPQGWHAGGNLTWVRTEILDNAGLDTTAYPMGGTLPTVPALTANAWLSGDLSRRLTAQARATVVGRQTVFTERFTGLRVMTHAYALLELAAFLHVSRSLDLYARLGNLLDAHYLTAYDRAGLPRTGVLGLRATS